MAHGPGYNAHPEHTIVLRPTAEHVIVTVAGQRVAQSQHAIVLAEAGFDPVVYIPREDVDMEALAPLDTHTHCPYKGEAVSFSLRMGAQAQDAQTREAQAIAWSYEQPYDETRSIGGYVAFDAGRVDAIELTPHESTPQVAG